MLTPIRRLEAACPKNLYLWRPWQWLTSGLPPVPQSPFRRSRRTAQKYVLYVTWRVRGLPSAHLFSRNRYWSASKLRDVSPGGGSGELLIDITQVRKYGQVEVVAARKPSPAVGLAFSAASARERVAPASPKD